MAARLNVLLLQGYGMTGSSMLSKSGAFRSDIKKFCNFSTIDAPFDCITQAPLPAPAPAPAPTAAPEQQQQQAQNQQLQQQMQEQRAADLGPGINLVPQQIQLQLEEGARAWYSFAARDADGKPLYALYDEGFQHIVQHCLEREREGAPPYDGVIAFSQGTIMANEWVRRLELDRLAAGASAAPTTAAQPAAGEGAESVLQQAQQVSEQQEHQQQEEPQQQADRLLPSCMQTLRFVVLVSGLLSKAQKQRGDLLEAAERCSQFSVPSLHIIGEADRLVDPALSVEMAERLYRPGDQRVVWRHEGGHVMASPARKPLKTFVQQVLSL